MKNKILILIILLSAFLRFWQLNSNPPSLYVDEVSLGYNAYSILKTGRDEYGELLPLFFRSFDTYNPALSVYTLVPTVWLFGLNELGVRIPSALAGTLSVFVLYLMAKKISSNKSIGIFSALMLGISPWHIQFSRFYHEANITLFFILTGLTLFLFYKNSLKFLVLISVIFGLGIYTSHGAKLSIPLTLISLVLFFYKDLLVHKTKIFIPIIIFAVFLIPIFANTDKALKRGQSVSVLNETDAIEKITEGYLVHLSPLFLFVSPDPNGRHAVGGMGHFYVFQIPLLVIGAFYFIRKQNTMAKMFLTLILLAPIPASLSVPVPHAGRTLPLSAYLSIIAAAGLFSFLNLNAKKYIKAGFLLILTLVALYNLLTYFHLYYKHYPVERSLDWSGGYKELVKYIDSVEKEYKQIAVTNYYAHPYIYFLFYKKFDPKIYQEEGNQKEFSKYVFFPEGTWKSFENQEDTLVVTTPSEGKSDYITIIKTFNEPVFKIWESNK